MKHGAEIGFASGAGFLEHVYDVSDVRRLTARGKNLSGLRVEGDETDAVGLLEHHVGNASGQSRGIMELGPTLGTGALVRHRTAGIQKHVAPEVGFLLVFADVETVALAVYLPVQVPDLVTGDVLAVLFELDAETLVRRPVQARAKAFHHPFGQYLMVG